MLGFKNLGEFYKPMRVYGSSIAAPLAVTLDTGEYGGRLNVEIWVKSSGTADFNVFGSHDGISWRLSDTITLSATGEEHRGYSNAYRYIKVETSAVGNHEIEIVASR